MVTFLGGFAFAASSGDPESNSEPGSVQTMRILAAADLVRHQALQETLGFAPA